MPHTLAPPPGIYPPLVNFFNEDYSLDIPTIVQHAIRSAKSGVAGLVILGSNGEAVHMDSTERVLLVSSIRKALDAEGLKMPLIVGCGQQSKRQTLQTIKEAKEAGGDFALVLPPSYWPTAMTKANVTGYFKELADESEMPILVYNFPLVANGVTVDSDQLIELAGHDNVVGCKLTCGVSAPSLSLGLVIYCLHHPIISYPISISPSPPRNRKRRADDRTSETSIEPQPTPTQNISQS
jgi:4-hydroxy-2-oxoglutarate aldolase